MTTVFSTLFGRIRLTTAVSGMVIGGIALSVAAILITLFINLSSSVTTTAEAKVQDTMRLAATMFQINMPAVKLTADDAGHVQKLVLRAMPKLRNSDMVDQIAGVAQEVITLYSYDAETGIFAKLSTSVRPPGSDVPVEPAVEVDPNAPKLASVAASTEPARDATPLDPAGDTFKALMAGQPIATTELIDGAMHHGLYMPVVDGKDQPVGAIYVGVDRTAIEAGVTQSMIFLTTVCAIVLAASAVLALLLSRALVRPIPALTKVMAKLAAGELEIAVPYVTYRNEIGTMAKAVEVFRENAAQIGVMSAEQVASSEHRRIERTQMMQTLKDAFGTVVHAAVDGDFSQRISNRFADDELNTLAQGVNELVESVDKGLNHTGSVLAALADADLSLRMEGNYSGAFAKLQADTNAVADKLTDIVGQLKGTSMHAQDRDRRNPVWRQRPQRTHHQAGGHHRGDLGGHGATGRHGDRQCQQGGSAPASRPSRCRAPPKKAAQVMSEAN